MRKVTSLSKVFPLDRWIENKLFKFGQRHKTIKRDAKLKVRNIRKRSR